VREKIDVTHWGGERRESGGKELQTKEINTLLKDGTTKENFSKKGRGQMERGGGVHIKVDVTSGRKRPGKRFATEGFLLLKATPPPTKGTELATGRNITVAREFSTHRVGGIKGDVRGKWGGDSPERIRVLAGRSPS